MVLNVKIEGPKANTAGVMPVLAEISQKNSRLSKYSGLPPVA
jgi:hypothetical protein